MAAKKTSHHSLHFSLIYGLIYLLISLGISHAVGLYSNSFSGPQVPDLLLSILPIVDTNIVFGPLAVAFWLFVGVLVLRNPRRAPFIIVSVATLLVVRSFFVFIIHPGHIVGDQTKLNPIIDLFTFKNDYFFSAHTAYPFLMALIFWKNKNERILFLILSVVFGISVILGRMHYSVDVFAAFFITYGVYMFCKRFFRGDLHMFRGY